VVGREEDNRLVKPKAFVCSQEGSTPCDDLKLACAAHQGPARAYKYPLLDRVRSELPKTATGKIQRFKLRT